MMIPPSGMNERHLFAWSEERIVLIIISVCFVLCIRISWSEVIILADDTDTVSIHDSLRRGLGFCDNLL